MKSASFILGIAVACIAAPALAKPAYVASTVNLRAAPGTGSEIVAKIPGGSLVDASACDEGWCEISWQDKKGFAIQKALDKQYKRTLDQTRKEGSAPVRSDPWANMRGSNDGKR